MTLTETRNIWLECLSLTEIYNLVLYLLYITLCVLLHVFTLDLVVIRLFMCSLACSVHLGFGDLPTYSLLLCKLTYIPKLVENWRNARLLTYLWLV